MATSPARDIPTRRISFEEGLAGLPRHYAGDGDLIFSHFFAVMSALFPDGEDFFVRSVRHYRDRVDDPALKAQVAGFIGQESVHGREHRQFNARLAELGYPTRRVERMTLRSLELRERIMGPRSNLALTAALEHVTATLAELVLTDEAARDQVGSEVVRDLFLWHALEESEHKAVAFDVYRLVGGTERTRVWTMRFVRVVLVLWVALHTLSSLAADPATYRRGNLRRSWRNFRRSPLIRRHIWEQLRDYDRAGFHPDDHDTSGLVSEWRDRLFGDAGSLNDKLSARTSAA